MWIALELGAPADRQAVLDLFKGDTLKTDTPPDYGGFDAAIVDCVLPFSVRYAPEERGAILWALHDWATEVGTERALRLVGDNVRARAGELFGLERLFTDLERASGAPLIERYYALQQEQEKG